MTHFTNNKLTSWLISMLLSLSLSHCASINPIIKAGPANSAGFLPAPELLSDMRERYPFHGVWMNMGIQDFQAYDSIYIADIDTMHLRENDWWDNANLNLDSIQDDARQLAIESETTFRDTLMHGMKLHVVDQPGPHTLVLELSIVELTPSKAWLSAIGLAAFAAPVAVGVPLGTAAALGQNGTVAIEGIIRDGESNEILLLFSDREASKIRILDLQTLSWYGHVDEIMHEWAEQLLEALTTPHEHMVADSDGFAWAPF